MSCAPDKTRATAGGANCCMMSENVAVRLRIGSKIKRTKLQPKEGKENKDMDDM